MMELDRDDEIRQRHRHVAMPPQFDSSTHCAHIRHFDNSSIAVLHHGS